MKRTRKKKWSLLVLRDADQNVKQFRVSKRSVVAAPAAAVLAVSSCIALLQLRSANELAYVEEAMTAQVNAYTHTIQEKDESVVSLKLEIERLKKQSTEMKTKLTDLKQLETKLQKFTETYGRTVSPTEAVNVPRKEVSTSSYSASADDAARTMAKLAAQSDLDFRAIASLVDAMGVTMADSLRKTQLRRAQLAAIPSGWPTQSHKLTSGFGYRKDPFTGRSTFHAGVDISGDEGDTIFAAADGTVTETGSNASKGNYIVITHRNNLKTVYYHLKRVEAKRNDTVVRGEKIGLLGTTGRSTAPHLHFQIMQNDEPVNPLKYLRLVKED
ncbi:M23 family metallopeptidase [Paenibacillus oenotherae]|uniref:M23 family metallopeptidase n=1 Tax=Paenibacillus oenotherae TaxID=1435645 RepID=A0ABS7D9X9_9BACL|nr:M23 family metallopeptidase [Paenibacillus oenotherae]MBW7476752.1 M23 family metallopeptidase [Paenibacillus oenotherae]